MILRPYQRAAIDALYRYFERAAGNPVIALPTGSGKSLVCAAFIREACTAWPSTRVLVLTHVKELLEQNCRTLLGIWPEAPVAYYSAGIGSKRVAQVTFAGIQSAHSTPALFSPVDLVIIDEAHLVPKKTEGIYRKFLDGLRRHNEAVKIIGLTATPYRLDSGLLVEGDGALFDEVVYDADIAALVRDGFLCPLVSRAGAAKADLSKVRVRGGEYVAGDAEEAFMRVGVLDAALDELVQLAGERRSWLVFCAGVAHAAAVAKALRARGIESACVTGETPKGERAYTLARFKDGTIRAVTNCDVLTTGFDAPGIDLIALMRPTKSTGLYVQMIGRGLRMAPGKADTLVLDYAGNVERHGPIDQIRVRPKREKGDGEGVTVAPVKECPECHAFCFPAAAACLHCGFVFPRADPHGTEASSAPVLAATHVETLDVDSVEYHRHEKLGSRPTMRVTYWCGLRRFSEWICIEHDGYARKQAVRWFWSRGLVAPESVDDGVELGRDGKISAPTTITVRPDGKYWRVVDARDFKEARPQEVADDEVPF